MSASTRPSWEPPYELGPVSVTVTMADDLEDCPTLIDQLRPGVADDDPEAGEQKLWATRILAELERDAEEERNAEERR